MSTYMAKANELEKKWYIIDAAGKPLGRVAATAAAILRGKHRPEFTLLMVYLTTTRSRKKSYLPLQRLQSVI